MLLASEMGPRSSMERMLDAIRLRDDRPAGAPPALPARPTSRGRLPSLRRQLLNVQFTAATVVPEVVKKSGSPEMPGLESYEKLEDGPAMELGFDDADRVLEKIAASDYGRNDNLRWIIWIQKSFRGKRARCGFKELKRGVTAIQSYVRGERARHECEYLSKRWKASIVIQKHVKCWIARKKFDDQRKDAILLQSVIRGWLAKRRYSMELPKLRDVKANKNLGMHLQEMKDKEREDAEVLRPSVSGELRKRILQAEAALRHKEEENVSLQHQLQQYETRWSEYEAKMKSLEQTWQTQLTSLQMSLAAAKESLITDATRPRRCDASSGHLYFDSEDTMSAETHSPEDTPAKQPRPSDARPARNSVGTRNAVSQLVNEFEQRSRNFEDNAGRLTEAKSRVSDSVTNPNEELEKLKVRFDAWRKDYRVRLQETKETLQKHENSEPKPRKRWWTPSCTR